MNLSAIRIKCAEIVGWTYIEQLAFTGIPKGSRGNADARVIPNYPESADAALQLVEWMSKPENGAYFWSADYFTNSPKYTAAFISQKKAFQMTADTFALAVCLAFLKANNIEPETL
jgi:ABC-type glycerol-3-phosphate transport system substrate-binding protein